MHAAVERPQTSSNEITVILNALTALKRGDASIRLPVEWHGALGRVADVFNDVVERNARMANELERLSKVVGKEGKLAMKPLLHAGNKEIWQLRMLESAKASAQPASDAS